jgi:hypothetical protein
VTEHAFPLVVAVAELLVLALLIAPRDAARVALGGVHLGAPTLELRLFAGLSVGAVNRPAARWFAVRGHRSSIRSMIAFTPAYHVTTG